MPVLAGVVPQSVGPEQLELEPNRHRAETAKQYFTTQTRQHWRQTIKPRDALFVPQAGHRIDTTGAPGGDEASECADPREQGDGADERQ